MTEAKVTNRLTIVSMHRDRKFVGNKPQFGSVSDRTRSSAMKKYGKLV